jgi:hypothetical protein
MDTARSRLQLTLSDLGERATFSKFIIISMILRNW